MKLNVKQKQFCEEYLIDLNAKQSAIRAGYSEKTAEQSSIRLLSYVKVKDYIQQLMEKRSERTEITQDMVLKELSHIATDDIKNYLTFRNEDDVTIVKVKDSNDIDTRNIQEISIGKDGQFKFKLYDKSKALVDIGKHLGMFTDKLELSGEIKMPAIKIGK